MDVQLDSTLRRSCNSGQWNRRVDIVQPRSLSKEREIRMRDDIAVSSDPPEIECVNRPESAGALFAPLDAFGILQPVQPHQILDPYTIPAQHTLTSPGYE